MGKSRHFTAHSNQLTEIMTQFYSTSSTAAYFGNLCDLSPTVFTRFYTIAVHSSLLNFSDADKDVIRCVAATYILSASLPGIHPVCFQAPGNNGCIGLPQPLVYSDPNCLRVDPPYSFVVSSLIFISIYLSILCFSQFACVYMPFCGYLQIFSCFLAFSLVFICFCSCFLAYPWLSSYFLVYPCVSSFFLLFSLCCLLLFSCFVLFIFLCFFMFFLAFPSVYFLLTITFLCLLWFTRIFIILTDTF